MNPTRFFTGRAIGLLILSALIGIVAAFYAFNNYIYEQKQTYVAGEVAQNFEGEADPSRMSLQMKTWVWVSAVYGDGTELRPTIEKPFTLTFGDSGKFSATTDCNSMGGSYTADTHLLSFSQIFSTKMYYEGSKEADFAALLEKTQSYFFTSKGELIFDFKFDSGSAVFK